MYYNHFMTMNAQTTVSKGAGFVLILSLLAFSFGSALAPVTASAADVLLASVAITASPSIICSGQSAHISWSSTDATSITIDQGIGSVLPYGDRYVSPTQTTTYTITGTNSTGGYAVASATVYVTGSCATPTPYPTWTPTPTPYLDLRCSPSVQSAQSGDWVTFTASYNYPTFYVGNFTWTAVGGHPSYGTGSSFGTRFYTDSISETRRVTVSDGNQSATCTVYIYGTNPTPTPYPQTLRCSPSHTTADSGERVTFTARGGTGYYTWYAPEGSPTYGDDATFKTRFYNNNWYAQYRYVTVSSGNQSATCTVNVNGSHWTPTPTPYDTLRCTSDITYADSGQRVTFKAYGGDSDYSWYAAEGNPSHGNDKTFKTRFTNNTWYSQYRTVTVTSGWQTATCTVTVNAGATWTPYPTPYPTYYPTPTTYPYVEPGARITLSQTGRNVTRGQSGEFTSLTARGGDTLDLLIRVRSTNGSYVTNAYVTDLLPGGLVYIPGSTTVNGRVTGDGVTTSGINVGTLSPYSDTVVKLSVRVHESAVPAWGTVTVNNTAQVRADGHGTISSLLPITLGTNASITAVSAVKTGPADSVWMALMTALLVTGLYAAYTRTDIFGRRMAFSEVSQLARTSDMNFSR